MPAMGMLSGARAAIVSYRLGMADGVSVTAALWAKALRRTGMRVRTVAGDGRADVLIPGLALDAARPPSRRELAAALDGVDVVVLDNVCSLPVNRAAGEALAAYLGGRRTVLRHHDLPWERERYAGVSTWPLDDPAWRHVTISESARRSLAVHRGIAATTVYHGFAERPCPRQRTLVRRRLRIPPRCPLILQPTRAIARKNVDLGLAFASALGGVYWLTGPAEEDYHAALERLLRDARVPVRRRLPLGVRMAGAYAACDAVVLPSSWEGFGLPLIESALHRKPIAVGEFPVARELAAFGFRWFDAADPGPLRAFLADPDPALLDHNEAIAHRHFGFDPLVRRLDRLLSGVAPCEHAAAIREQGDDPCDCLTA
ncbi:MAG: mannosylglucosylglycerate synthase [Pseudonocardiales bacterium]|nr:mannosylglucosylglycerate synthase [Pseudonocardiales bacterium]